MYAALRLINLVALDIAGSDILKRVQAVEGERVTFASTQLTAICLQELKLTELHLDIFDPLVTK